MEVVSFSIKHNFNLGSTLSTQIAKPVATLSNLSSLFVARDRKVLPTCELMFMGSEEALFVHVVVRRKCVFTQLSKAFLSIFWNLTKTPVEGYI